MEDEPGEPRVEIGAKGAVVTPVCELMCRRDDAEIDGLLFAPPTNPRPGVQTKLARVLFAVPEHGYTFSRSLAAPMCLAQALCVALASRLQKGPEAPRIPVVTGP